MAKLRSSMRKDPSKRYAATAWNQLVADNIQWLIENDPSKRFLISSAVIANCAAIEATLNDEYIDFFMSKMGPTYKSYIRPFLFMPFEERLRLMPILFSNYHYELNGDSEDIKCLLQLFQWRNRLVHPKQHWYFEGFTDDGADKIRITSESETNDFFPGELTEAESLTKLYRYTELRKRLIPFFHRLHSKINKKRFNTKGLLVKL